ncbi:GNAT family N-acetyltransferase [Pararhizobium arenae]|uniref:GNAT family N-acetyltransferase n=1 Tax=Pararhizobium arenae TaxID=1856850 RepID=UPI00094B2F4E|nr:GNAT family N-acetyltransferase [Pararhizobium arenae]
MKHLLDRPIWSALETRHAALGEGDGRARRFRPPIHTFAGMKDDEEESLEALAKLPAPGETLLIVQSDDIRIPANFVVNATAKLVQMQAEEHLPPIEDERIVPLTADDAQDMLDLAMLTKPGPFTLHAQSLGSFWGIRENGRLVAMAGERLKQPGFTELSGVCTHPDVRGRGIGRLLSLYVGGKIFANNERPYLHAYVTNTAAIGLYETLGFKVREAMNVAVITREA